MKISPIFFIKLTICSLITLLVFPFPLDCCQNVYLESSNDMTKKYHGIRLGWYSRLKEEKNSVIYKQENTTKVHSIARGTKRGWRVSL